MTHPAEVDNNPWDLDDVGAGLLAKAGKVVRDVVAPMAAETDEKALFPRKAIEAMKSEGLLAAVCDKKIGGHGQSLRLGVALCERFARECPSTAMVVKMHNCGTAVLEAHGTDALRKRVAKDGALTTLAFSEYASRSHFWLPQSTAVKSDKGYRLDASKQLITSADEADIYIWSSKPVESEGLSTIWAVPARCTGLKVPKPFNGMGLRGNASAPITAQDVKIPADHMLGADGKGFEIMMGVVMPWFSLQNCAVSIGCMEGALERAIKHVTSTGYAYDDSKIADFPQVRQHVAKMRCKIDMVRGFLLDALHAIEHGRGDATLRVLESKVIGAETSLEVLDLAMRICGGAAYRKEVGVERFFRDSRAATVMAPVSDALYEFIGKAACGMPLFS